MKVSDAKEKVCPFIQHMSIAASGLTMTTLQLENPHNHANAWCLTTGCMSWKGYEVGDYGDPSGSCRLLDKD